MGLARIGTVDEMGVDRVDLVNGSMSAGILTYGATLQYLKVPARDGTVVDVVLGFDTLEEYVTRPGRMGAVMLPLTKSTRSTPISSTVPILASPILSHQFFSSALAPK